MRVIAEVGDTVFLSGYCYSNKHGGTEVVDNESIGAVVTKAWYDEETGYRYWGKDGNGRRIYFSEFDVVSVNPPDSVCLR